MPPDEVFHLRLRRRGGAGEPWALADGLVAWPGAAAVSTRWTQVAAALRAAGWTLCRQRYDYIQGRAETLVLSFTLTRSAPISHLRAA